jgi:PAT family beta-lactamase induction signal transducer AmpG
MSESGARIHPAVFGLLVVPFGAVSGFIGTALAFLSTGGGLSETEAAVLVGWSSLVNMFKFSWAPIVDTTLTRRTWYGLALVGSVLGIVALSAVPLTQDRIPLFTALVIGASFATTVQAMALEALMAHLVLERDRGGVSGWFQAGNLGGYGLGGGLGLILMESMQEPWMAGALLGFAFLLGGLPILWLPDVRAESSGRPLVAEMLGAWGELLRLLRAREGLITGLLCLLPIGTGAATSVLSQESVAALWGAGQSEVALVNGVFNGVLSAAGCLAGGWLCSRWRSRDVYAGIALALAIVAFAMAFVPHSPLTFTVGNLTYAFVTGMAFAAYTGFVLEAIGKGAAATKYNGFAAMANTPIWYMGIALGWTVDMHGPTAMLVLEGAAAILGLFALVGVLRLTRGMEERPV